MAKIKWDETGKRLYETGVEQGVLYVQDETGNYPNGVPWNGLISVTESPSGAEATPLYANDTKYVELTSNEEFGATIEAYTYPDEFEACDGSGELAKGVSIGQQPRKPFGLCYKTIIGNDVKNNDHGYKLHLIYGCLAAPSEKGYESINDSPEAITFSWEASTTPVSVTGFKPTANITIDSTKVDAIKLTKLENILHGFDVAAFDENKTYSVGEYCEHGGKTYVCSNEVSVAAPWSDSDWTEDATAGVARLPLPDEVAEIMGEG